MVYGRTVVTTAAARVGLEPMPGPSNILVRIVSGTGPVYIGKQGVTTDNGFRLDPSDPPLECVLGQDEAMWAVKQSGSSVVCWMHHTERIPF